MIATLTLIAGLILIPTAQMTMSRLEARRARIAAEQSFDDMIETDLTVLHHLWLANRIEARQQIALSRTIAQLNA